MKIELKPLAQQAIVITGASSGIGLATAERAVAAGASLFITARSAETLAQIAERLSRNGARVEWHAADIGVRAETEEIAQRAVAAFGRIDTWINNAGVSIYGRLEEPSDQDNRRLFDTNFWGVVYGSFAALRYMRERGGAIINVGSEVSETVIPLQGMYSASKHAVKGFTDALRIEVQELDEVPVAITLIQPAAVDTPFPQHARNYLSREPKLPDPKIDPLRVAEAILECAVNPTRHRKVGMLSKLNTAIAKVAPVLSDKMSALQAEEQKSDLRATHSEGSLYEGGGMGQVRGRDLDT